MNKIRFFALLASAFTYLLVSCGNSSVAGAKTDAGIHSSNDSLPEKAQKIDIPGAGLRNFYRVDDGVYRSDQPDAADFKLLEAYGIREVLNMRRYHSDDRKMRGTSLVLHRLRTNASTIGQGELIEALRIIKNRKGPILIHCWHGSDRTGAVIAMYRIVFQGYGKEAAVLEMVEGGFGFHRQFDQIIDVILNADVDSIKQQIGM